MCSYLALLPILLKIDSKGNIGIRKAEDAEQKELPKGCAFICISEGVFLTKKLFILLKLGEVW